jgi:predicted Zn-dependent peptidase
MTKLYELLGAEDEAAAIVALSERDKSSAALLAERDALTEKLSAAEAEATKLAERLASLEAERVTAEREALIARLSVEGKLPPALHDWARSLTAEKLAEFGDKAPSANPAPLPPVSDEVTLTSEDLAVMKQHGLTRDQFIAARKAEKSVR